MGSAYLLQWITIVSYLEFIYASFSCEDYWVEGKYCLDDYTGYHICTSTKGGWERYKHTTAKCPPNTRCSCHFRNRCDKSAKICVPFTLPNPMVDPAIFSFKGAKVKEYLYGQDEDEVTHLSGVIRQNKAQRKYMKIYKRQNKQYFYLVLPRKPFGYYVYYGNYDDKFCHKYYRWGHYFDFVGYDLERYTLQKTWNVEENKDEGKNIQQQEWYFKKGDYEGQYFDHIWVVSKVNEGKSVKPKRSIVKFRGHEDNIYKSTTTLDWTTKVHGKVNTDSWFVVPDFC